MKFQWTGIGLVFGAAVGLLLGMLVFEANWWAPMVGVTVGLLVGAIVDAQQQD